MGITLTQVGKAVSLVFCIILLFLGVDFADSIDDNNYQAVGVIDYMTRNFNTNPIYDIIPISNTEICPDAYEQLSLGNWTGTYVGCSKGFLGLYFGSCWLGSTIPAQSPVPLYYWNQTRFCVKRNQNYSFSGDQCGDGYISCTGSMCVSVDEQCPITSLINQTTTQPGDYYIDFENEYLVIGNQTGIPIFSVEISLISPSPCFAQGWNPSDRNAYKLAIENFDGCGFAGQDNSVYIFSQMMESSLYSDNNLQDTINSLPDYTETISGDQVYLITRDIIQLAPSNECNQTLYKTTQYLLPILQDLVSFQDEIINFFEYEILLIILSIVFLIKKADKKQDIAYSVFTILDIIYFIYISSIVSSQIDVISSFNMPYAPLSANACFFDTIFDDAITNYNQFQSDFPSSIKDKIIIIFVVLGLRNIINTVVTLLGLRAARSKTAGKQKSVLSDLYSIFCICFALTGGDE